MSTAGAMRIATPITNEQFIEARENELAKFITACEEIDRLDALGVVLASGLFEDRYRVVGRPNVVVRQIEIGVAADIVLACGRRNRPTIDFQARIVRDIFERCPCFGPNVECATKANCDVAA